MALSSSFEQQQLCVARLMAGHQRVLWRMQVCCSITNGVVFLFLSCNSTSSRLLRQAQGRLGAGYCRAGNSVLQLSGALQPQQSCEAADVYCWWPSGGLDECSPTSVLGCYPHVVEVARQKCLALSGEKEEGL